MSVFCFHFVAFHLGTNEQSNERSFMGAHDSAAAALSFLKQHTHKWHVLPFGRKYRCRVSSVGIEEGQVSYCRTGRQLWRHKVPIVSAGVGCHRKVADGA